MGVASGMDPEKLKLVVFLKQRIGDYYNPLRTYKAIKRGTRVWTRCEEKWNISATDERKWNPFFAAGAFLESSITRRRKNRVYPIFDCFILWANRNSVYIL